MYKQTFSKIFYPIVFLFFMAHQSSVFSQEKQREPLVTDRPDITESSRTVPHHALQIETGFVYDEYADAGIDYKRFILTSTLLRYGIFRGLELRLNNQYIYTRYQLNDQHLHIAGLDNFSTGVKVNITKEKGFIPEMALIAHLVLPTATAQLRSEKVYSDYILALSQTISEQWSIGYNLGWTGTDENEKGSGLYSAALGYSIGRCTLFAELFGEWINLSKAATSVDAGFSWLARESLQLDTSVGMDLTTGKGFFNLGLSARFFR